MSREITNFINGKHVSAADGETTDLVDPSTGDVFASEQLCAAFGDEFMAGTVITPTSHAGLVPGALGSVEPVVVRVLGFEDPLHDADVAGDLAHGKPLEEVH